MSIKKINENDIELRPTIESEETEEFSKRENFFYSKEVKQLALLVDTEDHEGWSIYDDYEDVRVSLNLYDMTFFYLSGVSKSEINKLNTLFSEYIDVIYSTDEDADLDFFDSNLIEAFLENYDEYSNVSVELVPDYPNVIPGVYFDPENKEFIDISNFATVYIASSYGIRYYSDDIDVIKCREFLYFSNRDLICIVDTIDSNQVKGKYLSIKGSVAKIMDRQEIEAFYDHEILQRPSDFEDMFEIGEN